MTLLIIFKPTYFLIIIFSLSLHPPARAQQPGNKDPNQFSSPDPLFTGVTVTLFTVVFILLYLVFYYIINHFFGRPARSGPTPVRTDHNPLTRGLDPYVLRTFPVFKYSEVVRLGLDKRSSLECAVCLSQFEEPDETLRLLPKCDHVFHVGCVDTWLEHHSTCPYCRAELEPPPDDDSGWFGSGRVDELGSIEEEEEEMETVNGAENDVVEEVEGSSKRERVRRWNSTGHVARKDWAGVAVDGERFTLRLPEEVRNDMRMIERLYRSRSCITKITPIDIV